MEPVAASHLAARSPEAPPPGPVAITYDAETGNMPLEELERFTGTYFDESKVAYTKEILTTKDPLKRQAKMAEYLKKARAKHEERLLKIGLTHPLLIKFTSFGYYRDGKFETVLGGGEHKPSTLVADPAGGPPREVKLHTSEQLVEDFWARYVKARDAGEEMLGWNNAVFDNPLIVVQSRIHGIPIPASALQELSNGRQLIRGTVDLMRRYCGWGSNGAQNGKKLKYASVEVGGPTKSGDGALFTVDLMSDDPERVGNAIDYQNLDNLTAAVVAVHVRPDLHIPMPPGAPTIEEMAAMPLEERQERCLAAARAQRFSSLVAPQTRSPEQLKHTQIGPGNGVGYMMFRRPLPMQELEGMDGGLEIDEAKLPKDEPARSEAVKQLRLEYQEKLLEGAETSFPGRSEITALLFIEQGKAEVLTQGPGVGEKELLQYFRKRYDQALAPLYSCGNSDVDNDNYLIRCLRHKLPVPDEILETSAGEYRSFENMRDLSVKLAGPTSGAGRITLEDFCRVTNGPTLDVPQHKLGSMVMSEDPAVREMALAQIKVAGAMLSHMAAKIGLKGLEIGPLRPAMDDDLDYSLTPLHRGDSAKIARDATVIPGHPEL